MKKMKNRKTSERVDAYLRKKERIKRRKKVFFMSLVCLTVSVIFLLKAPMFEVKGFTVIGNKMVKKEGVLNKTFISGKNIFLLDINSVEAEILKNPYIQGVQVTRSLPNQIKVELVERKMFYKMKVEDEIYILNNSLYIMDIIKEDKDLALVEVKGIKVDSKNVGERINKSDELAKIAQGVAENLIDKNKKSIFTMVDLSDKGDISIFKEEIEIILGEPKELEQKYKQAIDILDSKKINLKAGYIDVSVPSQAVIKEIEEKKNQIKTELAEDKKNDKIEEENINKKIERNKKDKEQIIGENENKMQQR